jgi:hypothetical protein
MASFQGANWHSMPAPATAALAAEPDMLPPDLLCPSMPVASTHLVSCCCP